MTNVSRMSLTCSAIISFAAMILSSCSSTKKTVYRPIVDTGSNVSPVLTETSAGHQNKSSTTIKNYTKIEGALSPKQIMKSLEEKRSEMNHCFSLMKDKEMTKNYLPESKTRKRYKYKDQITDPIDGVNGYLRRNEGMVKSRPQGEVAVSFEIRANGQVVGSRISRSEFDHPRFEHCITSIVENTKFQASSGNTKVIGYEIWFGYRAETKPK
ncbi:MAG: hypothetical protein HRU19_26605 [Pseudobacteriovorax sp.]|nr:hypothetical protein [Pseudobacteriovorax sp.]